MPASSLSAAGAATGARQTGGQRPWDTEGQGTFGGKKAKLAIKCLQEMFLFLFSSADGESRVVILSPTSGDDLTVSDRLSQEEEEEDEVEVELKTDIMDVEDEGRESTSPVSVDG